MSVPAVDAGAAPTGMASNAMPAVINQNMLLALASRSKDSFLQLVKERKPWSEVFDRSCFAKPANVGEATTRLSKNVKYFKINYALFIITTTALCFLATPSALLVLAFLAALWFFVLVLRPGPVTIGGRTFGEREKFMGLAGFSLIVAFFLSHIGTVLFYALGISLVAVGIHGAFRVPDDLFLDEPEAASGFLSFLSVPPQPLSAGPPTISAAV